MKTATYGLGIGVKGLGLEGQGDLARRRKTPISHVMTPVPQYEPTYQVSMDLPVGIKGLVGLEIKCLLAIRASQTLYTQKTARANMTPIPQNFCPYYESNFNRDSYCKRNPTIATCSI